MTEMPTVSPADETDELMTPVEVAKALRIGVVSLARWARTGRIASIALPNGHRRYRSSEIAAILGGSARQNTAPGGGATPAGGLDPEPAI
ncbi:helix-turn-helix domain-containing protein [Frankia sp. Cppng1_Ct_nod]|uniref:helix-turn-helix domain-containing protein n=1 Tax=Frankia sp. Cppng1_Ct_nod TaxID=2897162 RepID=UPI001C30BAEF|nr:helix-turn-helix domain-containing protein [Frankia sp. Cppng1_Ct_nod]